QLMPMPDYVYMFLNSRSAQAIGDVKWFSDSKAFLVYGDYDIWKIDPSGKAAPIDITKGYGAGHHTILRFVDEKENPFTDGYELLTGFDVKNKQNGFYKLDTSASGIESVLPTGP